MPLVVGLKNPRASTPVQTLKLGKGMLLRPRKSAEAEWTIGSLVKTMEGSTCFMVEGAGIPGVNGRYTRTHIKCQGEEMWRKNKTTYALMRRGNEGWSLVDLPTSMTRWSLAAAELYRANRSPPGSSPPFLGWYAVEGEEPSPMVSPSKLPNGLEEHFPRTGPGRGGAAVPGALALPDGRPRSRLSESRTLSRAALPQIKPKMQPSHSEPTLPLVNSRARLQALGVDPGPEPRALQADIVRGGTPGALQEVSRRTLPGQVGNFLHCFRVTLHRPNARIPWGFNWQDLEYRHSGARVLAAVDGNSPLARWNIWQQVRSRPTMCVEEGDRLLRVDGAWAYYENEVGTQDGDLASEAVRNAKTINSTASSIVLEFGRWMMKPAAPHRPDAMVAETDLHLIMKWPGLDDALHQIIAWAVIVHDLDVGQTYGIDGATGDASLITTGAEIGAFRPEVTEVIVREGLQSGHSYAGAVAVLSQHGWSPFTEFSRPAKLERHYKMDDVAAANYEWAELLEELSWPGRVYFVVPSEIEPGVAAPVEVEPGPTELMAMERPLRLQAILDVGVRGLRVVPSSDERGVEIAEVVAGSPVANWNKAQTNRNTVVVHGAEVAPTLQVADLILRANGLSGSNAILAELQRRPAQLALTYARHIGVKGDDEEEAPRPGDSTAPYFSLDPRLDHQMVNVAEELVANRLLEPDEGQLTLSMVLSEPSELLPAMLEVSQLYEELSQIGVMKGPINRCSELLKAAESRVHQLKRMENIYAASTMPRSKTDSTLMALQHALGDIACSPSMLEQCIEELKVKCDRDPFLSDAARPSIVRAEGLQELWSFRRSAAEAHAELLSAMQETLQQEKDQPVLTSEYLQQIVDDEEDQMSEFGFSEPQPVELTRLKKAFKAAERYRTEMAFHFIEADQVLKRNLIANFRLQGILDLKRVVCTPTTTDKELNQAYERARYHGVENEIITTASKVVDVWQERNRQNAARNSLMDAMKHLAVHLRHRTFPAAGFNEQRELRSALKIADLGAKHPMSHKGAELLARWEGDNTVLRAEARLQSAMKRCSKGYNKAQPNAGDILSKTIAEVAQMGVSYELIGDARNLLEDWKDQRIEQARRDVLLCKDNESRRLFEKYSLERRATAASTASLPGHPYDEENEFPYPGPGMDDFRSRSQSPFQTTMGSDQFPMGEEGDFEYY